MTAVATTILKQALRLDAVERAELIEAIFRSFDKTADDRIDSQWAAEAEARIDAYDRGRIKARPAEAVLKRIAKR
jgi:putative addiction module component (TIGR02574 family)